MKLSLCLFISPNTECPVAPTVANAGLTTTGNAYRAFGGTAAYQCNSGYGLKDGPTQISCGGTGQWATVGFSCLRNYLKLSSFSHRFTNNDAYL